LQPEKTAKMSGKYKKLMKCLALDAIGMASMAVPGVGPFLDIVWAPIAAFISYKMFGNKRGRYTSVITFVEEILPGSDILPTFTIFWFLFDFLEVGNHRRALPYAID
jgi:hypothetical protein